MIKSRKLLSGILLLITLLLSPWYVSAQSSTYPNGALLEDSIGIIRYPNGSIARDSIGVVRYPNGSIARDSIGVVRYPNGSIARDSIGVVRYSNGSIARDSTGRTYYQNGAISNAPITIKVPLGMNYGLLYIRCSFKQRL